MGRIVTNEPNTAKLPIIGNIRVGEKVTKPGTNIEYPVSLDYFKATGDYAIKFHQAFGEKPTNFGIIFMADSIDDVCNERYELRDEKTGALVGSGDGINFKIWNPDKVVDIKTKGDYEDFIADTPEKKTELAKLSKKLSNNGQWRAILTLKFVIPKASSVMGLWKFESKGVMSSIPNIRDTFDQVQKLAGTAVNIPFDLHIKKVKTQRPGDKRLYPVVTLIPNVSHERLEDVRGFLQQGNSIMDMKNFLQQGSPAAKAIKEKAGDMGQKQLPPTADGKLF